MPDYYNVTTTTGDAEIAKAIANNIKLAVTHIVFGDGNGSVPTPSKTRTTLIREVHRQPVNKYELHPTIANWIVIEAIIPSNIGGFTVREIGVIANNKLISHGSHAPFEKVADPSGVSEYRIKFTQDIKDGKAVSIMLDQSLIYASQAWVEENYIKRSEIIDNLTSNNIDKPLSANQGKALQDNKLAKTENAVSASKLETARTVQFSGAGTGSFGYDGSANSSCILTLANSGVVAGTYGNNATVPVVTVDAKGLLKVVATQAIRVATTAQTGIVQLADALNDASTTKALTAAMGKKLQEEKLDISEVGTSGDKIPRLNANNNWGGTQNYSYRIRLARPNGLPYISLSNATATETGVASFGRILFGYGDTETDWGITKVTSFINAGRTANNVDFLHLSVGDHTLSINSDGSGKYSGNASSASKLETARTIGGVGFDGTTSINLPGVNATGNQSTSGNAATATKLKTARKISVSGAVSGNATFDGASDVTINVVSSDIDVLAYTPIPWMKVVPPSGFLVFMGQSISQAVYPILFSLYGPRLPDMRGEFIRGFDNGRGVDTGRALLSLQLDEFKSHNHNRNPLGEAEIVVSNNPTSPGDLQGSTWRNKSFTVTGDKGGIETRPRNIAFNYIVKAG